VQEDKEAHELHHGEQPVVKDDNPVAEMEIMSIGEVETVEACVDETRIIKSNVEGNIFCHCINLRMIWYN